MAGTNGDQEQVEPSNNQDIDGILWGWRWKFPAEMTYSFPTSSAEYISSGYTAVNGFEAFNADQNSRSNASSPISTPSPAWPSPRLRPTTLTLRSASPGHVDQRRPNWAGHDQDGERQPARPWGPYRAFGDTCYNPNEYSPTPQIGTDYYTAGLLHEVGHAVGLKHGHATRPPSTCGSQPPDAGAAIRPRLASNIR